METSITIIKFNKKQFFPSNTTQIIYIIGSFVTKYSL